MDISGLGRGIAGNIDDLFWLHFPDGVKDFLSAAASGRVEDKDIRFHAPFNQFLLYYAADFSLEKYRIKQARLLEIAPRTLYGIAVDFDARYTAGMGSKKKGKKPCAAIAVQNRLRTSKLAKVYNFINEQIHKR